MNKPEINGQQLVLDYPCPWTYKAVGTDLAQVESAIRDVAGDRECIILPSKKSRTGKYVSVGLEIVVTNEEDRTGLYKALQGMPAIKMVL